MGKAIENFESILEYRKSILSVYGVEQLKVLDEEVAFLLTQLEVSDRENYSQYHKDFDLLKEEFAPIRKNTIVLEESDYLFLSEVYLANKAIHVEGIGNISSESSLYSTRNIAAEELEKAFKKIPKLRASQWSFIGTLLASIFGLISLTYLGRFVFELSGLPGLILAIMVLSIVIIVGLDSEQQKVQGRN